MKASSLVLVLFAGALSMCGQTPDPEVIARVVMTQGEVFVLPAGTTDWIQIQNPLELKPGWSLRTGENSRSRVRLRDQSILTLGPMTLIQFGKRPQGIFTRVWRGIISFFHRDEPGQLEVEGPDVLALIHGTEFVFAVGTDQTSTLTLYDGRVELTGGLVLTNGEVAVSAPGRPPQKTAALTVSDLKAIQWCLYYPAVLHAGDLEFECNRKVRAVGAGRHEPIPAHG